MIRQPDVGADDELALRLGVLVATADVDTGRLVLLVAAAVVDAVACEIPQRREPGRRG